MPGWMQHQSTTGEAESFKCEYPGLATIEYSEVSDWKWPVLWSFQLPAPPLNIVFLAMGHVLVVSSVPVPGFLSFS